MDFRSLLGRPGFKQALNIDAKGGVEGTAVAERVSGSDVLAVRDGAMSVGARLGLGALSSVAHDCHGDAALFVIAGAAGTTAGVFAAAGDALEDRSREFKQLIYPSDGSVVSRHMGFAEVRR